MQKNSEAIQKSFYNKFYYLKKKIGWEKQYKTKSKGQNKLGEYLQVIYKKKILRKGQKPHGKMKKAHVKISPASFTIKEMQVKTTLKYHFLFIGWVGIQKFWHLVLVRVRGNMLIRCCGRGVDRGTLCGDELATMGKNHKSTYSLSQQVCLGIHST